MLFLEESESELQLLASLQQAEHSYAGTELLHDARIQLEEYYLRYGHWEQAGRMLLQDLAWQLEGIPVSDRTIDVVRRLHRVGRRGKETLVEAAQLLEKTSERQETGQVKGQLRIWAGRMYEELGELGRAEESYLAAWKLSPMSGRKELIGFCMRTRLFNQVEELLYQDYLKGNTSQALRELNWFYKEVISSCPAKCEDLSTNHHNSIAFFQRFLSLPRLHLTHSPSFPLSKTHLPLLNVRIHTFAVFLTKAKRLTRGIQSIVKSMQLMFTAGTILRLDLAEVIKAYIGKAGNNPVVYQEDVHFLMLNSLAQYREEKIRDLVLGFLINSAWSLRKFEEMERFTVRSKWNFRALPYRLRQTYNN